MLAHSWCLVSISSLLSPLLPPFYKPFSPNSVWGEERKTHMGGAVKNKTESCISGRVLMSIVSACHCLNITVIGSIITEQLWTSQGLPWWLSSKEFGWDAGDAGLIPGSGRSPRGGNGNLLHYSCLENPTDRGPVGSQRNDWMAEHTRTDFLEWR